MLPVNPVMAADPAIVHQITTKQFSRFKERFMPSIDNPLLFGRAQEAAQSMMVVAK